MIRGRKLVAGLAACAVSVGGRRGERTGRGARAQRCRPRGVQLGDAGRRARNRRIGAVGGFSSTARGGRQREPVMFTDAEIEGTAPTVPKKLRGDRAGLRARDQQGPDARRTATCPMRRSSGRSRSSTRPSTAPAAAPTRTSTSCCGAVDRTTNEAWFNMGPNTSEERAAKRQLHSGGPDALNLYTAEGGGFLGLGVLPEGRRGLQRPRVPRRHRGRLRLASGRRHPELQPRVHRHARGRALDRALPHVPERLLGRRRPDRRHAAPALPDLGLPRGQGHVPRSRGSTRSTTTWTTPTTPATRSSPRSRASGWQQQWLAYRAG